MNRRDLLKRMAALGLVAAAPDPLLDFLEERRRFTVQLDRTMARQHGPLQVIPGVKMLYTDWRLDLDWKLTVDGPPGLVEPMRKSLREAINEGGGSVDIVSLADQKVVASAPLREGVNRVHIPHDRVGQFAYRVSVPMGYPMHWGPMNWKGYGGLG